ncbi:uncharacterized protein BCN122_I0988 [Burkholderia cenocepacia]|nr:uncharacterized protein BCN122_I0988 [Burkholderia cenocepacia]
MAWRGRAVHRIARNPPDKAVIFRDERRVVGAALAGDHVDSRKPGRLGPANAGSIRKNRT